MLKGVRRLGRDRPRSEAQLAQFQKIHEAQRGKHPSLETRQKLSKAHRKYQTEETRKKISATHKGMRLSEESKRKIAEANRGNQPSVEARRKMSESQTGEKNHNWGKHFSEETRRRLSESHRGEKSGRWKGGVTSENQRMRRGLDYRLWRKAIFERDNFSCQKCKESGGDLTAHHINNFSEFPELRFSIENGIALCRKCHRAFHKMFGEYNNTREQLEEFMG